MKCLGKDSLEMADREGIPIFPNRSIIITADGTFYQVVGIITNIIDTADIEPVKQKHYPVLPAVQALMFAELGRMLDTRQSHIPWNSPVSLVRKGTKNRLCLNDRKLNALLLRMPFRCQTLRVCSAG